MSGDLSELLAKPESIGKSSFSRECNKCNVGITEDGIKAKTK